MSLIDKRRSPLRLLRRDLISTSALPRVLFIVPHGMWVCCSSAALCVSIASMSIARDVIPQQILGSCADCQSASLSFAPASDAGLPILHFAFRMSIVVWIIRIFQQSPFLNLLIPA